MDNKRVIEVLENIKNNFNDTLHSLNDIYSDTEDLIIAERVGKESIEALDIAIKIIKNVEEVKNDWKKRDY